MKWLFFCIFAFLICLNLKSNPIAPPTISINELYFDSAGNWTIELYYSNFREESHFFEDSIVTLTTLTDTGYLKSFEIKGNKGIVVIKSDNFLNYFYINPVRDSLCLSYRHYPSILTYGDSSSFTNSPKIGIQSIARTSTYYDAEYSLDKSPTIGFENDTTGMCGILRGRIFDANNELLNTKNNVYINFALEMQPPLKITNGFFQTSVFSNNKTIYMLEIGKFIGFHLFTCEKKAFSMNIDSIVELDIRLTYHTNKFLENIYIEDSLFWLKIQGNSINKKIIKTNFNSIIKIYPNPLKSGTVLHYKINLPVKSATCEFELVTVEGKKSKSFIIQDNEGTISMPSGLKNGVYTLILVLNKKRIASQNIFISR